MLNSTETCDLNRPLDFDTKLDEIKTPLAVLTYYHYFAIGAGTRIRGSFVEPRDLS